MREKLISFLKHYSPLYRFIQIFYWKVLSTRAHILGSKIEEKSWANRSLSEVKKGFNDLNNPHRRLIVEKLVSSRLDISSILEVGCGYGPNLYLLTKQFPQAEIIGIDINPHSIQEGNKWFTQQGNSNIKLTVGKADDLSQFLDKSFDVVFTDAVLMYIGPDKIKKVMREMFRITRETLIFIELHYKSQVKDPYGLGIYHLGFWKRNYIDLLSQFVEKNKISLYKIPKDLWPARNWSESGFLIEVTMDKRR